MVNGKTRRTESMKKLLEKIAGLLERVDLNRRNKTVIYLILTAGLLSVLAFAGYAAVDLPAFNPEQLSGVNSTLLYDQDGQVFSILHAGENRTDASLEEIPDELLKSFIAAEDRAFYSHHGLNFRGVARALLKNVQSGDLTAQGASTITQQLARNSFLSAEKTWQRKIREALLAFRLEAVYSKDEIMEMYLNKVYFGAGAYGVQAAARTYFGKDVSQLNLAESALIAGLVKSPNNYNPLRNLDKAYARQKTVLASMVDAGFIDENAASEAASRPLQLVQTTPSSVKFGYFTDAVIEEAIQVLKDLPGYEDADHAIYTSGLQIYTTLNTPLQTYAEEYFRNAANFPGSSQAGGPEIQVGMVILENSSGSVQAIMGGREYLLQRGFNRATSAYRQPGSAIKPITVYSTALEKGMMPYTLLSDARVSYKTASGVWTPVNYDGKYRGLISMRTAVKYSVNTYAVQLMDKVGIRSGYENGTSFGLNLVESGDTNDLNLAALALGGLTRGVTPLQMAGAYSIIGNSGMFNKPHFISKIIDSQGQVVYEHQPAPKPVISEQTAWIMSDMLQTVVDSGTGTKAKVPGVPTAGKTGTTSDLTDVWFCGFTPAFAGAIWMGYDDPRNKMINVAGGGFPALMFRAMMQKAHEIRDPGAWTMPADIVKISVCQKSGRLAAEHCPDSQVATDYCAGQYVPEGKCDRHNGEGETSNPAVGAGAAEPTTVKICTDPRHRGKIFKANISGSAPGGGCPARYVHEIVIPGGKQFPSCPLSDHRIK